MKSLILAAGYATRMYPLTKDFPKPLLEVGGKTILDRLVADIDKIEIVTQHIIVTNSVFYPYFMAWKARSHYKKEIVIVNDGTKDNDNRLGAMRDILYVIENRCVNEDLLVAAGCNVFTFLLKEFVLYALEKSTSCITCYFEQCVPVLQKSSVLVTDDDFRVLGMLERPKIPLSNWAVPPFYYFKDCDLKLINKAISSGLGFDAPGSLIAWLCKKTEMFAWEIKGKFFDIGNIESYERVCKIFER
jgi:glucose-1-phosphate thymidylyltransferase